jgi:hypothetical protein
LNNARRFAATLTTLVTGAMCLSVVPASPAAAVTTARANHFNGDGYRDLAAGDPDARVGSLDQAGQAKVIFGSRSGLDPKRAQTISQNSAGIPGAAEKQDSFGSGLVSADFDADGYADLAIAAEMTSSPGRAAGS